MASTCPLCGGSLKMAVQPSTLQCSACGERWELEVTTRLLPVEDGESGARVGIDQPFHDRFVQCIDEATVEDRWLEFVDAFVARYGDHTLQRGVAEGVVYLCGEQTDRQAARALRLPTRDGIALMVALRELFDAMDIAVDHTDG